MSEFLKGLDPAFILVGRSVYVLLFVIALIWTISDIRFWLSNRKVKNTDASNKTN